MSEENPSIISHVSVGTNDFTKAAAFYDAVLSAIGVKRVLEFEDAVAYGKVFPEFWVQAPIDGKKASIGNGTHFAFMVGSRDLVHAFYDAALKAGAKDDGKPGPRPHYGAPYYGCFARDPDGHKIEAVFWDETQAG
ncbi:VOC family protein [Oceanibacterium hippocampi]|uniref:Glyoxalase-like domain protein n=1 Tax=Oceanibacterium hippocampi TaxID=745714 RepID=A0A1Y5TXF0_9PROT|nr:VOC family protein [Oceanibacterium hippocampi]SLN76140.1 Glyoxalase-like domain protein [Oceanibacterium hippocampi]